eukprot:TRINITY_DN518_c0_g1_i8.p1 TRINITY_DN518_c0_g1~~TRINITY_DN518_c0_g1_i8.p1  ORF type:complete len:141 (-),score=34.99 TRINITY_DN518_c0_g1_i8:234-656(-)
MFPESLSRRRFFTHLVTAGTGRLARLVAVAVPAREAVPPQQAWVITELGWEYNDEFTYPEGEFLRSKLFLDKASADAECQRLCAEFFAAETPEEFEMDIDSFHLADRDPATITWDELRLAGFPDPFSVQLVQTAEELSPS